MAGKMFACNCLNVVIETQTNDFEKVNADLLNLSADERNDNFFKQDIQQVGALINIKKTHPGLIESRNIGSWVVHYCLNCDVHTHALHRDKGASCVLFNTNLLSKDLILSLRSSEFYSKLYNIIIVDPNETNCDDLLTNTYLPSKIDNTIKALKQIASDTLTKESLAVEKRIKKYVEEQYNELDNLRDRAFREQEALAKIILNNYLNNIEQPKSTNIVGKLAGKSTETPSRLNEPLAAGSEHVNPRCTPKRQKSSPAAPVMSFDTEGLFEFDGMDDNDNDDDEDEDDDDIEAIEDSDIEESDIEETINKDQQQQQQHSIIKIPRGQSASASLIAKSLPMNIPTFLSQDKNHLSDDIDDLPPREENLDIAASIKALAKSVHGDAIFGDLPRPKFSTQI